MNNNKRFSDGNCNYYLKHAERYYEKKNYNSAIKYIDRAINISKNNQIEYFNLSLDNLINKRGIWNRDSGNYKQSIKDFSTAIKNAPGNWSYFINRGHSVSVLTSIPNYPKGFFYEGYGIFTKNRETYKSGRVTGNWYHKKFFVRNNDK